jgi:hypothetical protein
MVTTGAHPSPTDLNCWILRAKVMKPDLNVFGMMGWIDGDITRQGIPRNFNLL